MSTDAVKNSTLESTVKSVINVLQDSQKGFADIGEHLKDETLKRYFLAESLKRARFRAELENELHRHGVKDVHETGTVSGTLHRAWGDLKGKVFGSSDHELLATAEQGEDVAKKTYTEALEQELPLPLRQLLTEQFAHIQTSHGYVKLHRDETK
ncbi:PA2169 family four-helix-bundle protein [Granulicella sp. WH15]|uniref:PA2169 family four-helix-bundle protein n=1 Tax=Granulicella sp. WH15 TaxID=2602070 RepID=UPI001366D7F6|nr:PA2169 family four-helix-bundle protein [Granulicella sp. WH15]QHN02506.1 PA2169 family four-helix-bundle protein [Granulicella sp. WH15]